MRHWFWKPTSVVWKYGVPSVEKWRTLYRLRSNWYRSWTRFPLFSWVWMVFQCPRYSSLVSWSSGNILGSTDEMLEDWGLWICSLFAGLLDGPGSGHAVLLTSIIGITSGLSCRAQWRSMFSLLFKKIPQTGQTIV